MSCEAPEETLVLQLKVRGQDFRFLYGTDEESLQELAAADGREINPEEIGTLTGTMTGMFATGNGKESQNEAAFDFFEIKER